MNRIALAAFLCFVIAFAQAQTQGQETQQAQANYQKADKEMDAVYQKVLKEYKGDAEFIGNFKIAQRLWAQFRDAEMKARYPDREVGYYGNSQPLCWYLYITELTRERTERMKRWLDGADDTDMCAGSVKIKN